MEPFNGNTSYNLDYVKHPLPAREQRRKEVWQPTASPTGDSMYMAHFPWKIAAPARSMQPREEPRRAYPFQGVTSYANDYVEHDVQPRAAPVADVGRSRGHTPFEGVTTYKQDFQRQQGRPPTPIRPPAAAREPAPFQGRSEYAERYIKMREPVQWIHIEPALRKRHETAARNVSGSREGHRPRSAPSGTRRHRK